MYVVYVYIGRNQLRVFNFLRPFASIISPLARAVSRQRESETSHRQSRVEDLLGFACVEFGHGCIQKEKGPFLIQLDHVENLDPCAIGVALFAHSGTEQWCPTIRRLPSPPSPHTFFCDLFLPRYLFPRGPNPQAVESTFRGACRAGPRLHRPRIGCREPTKPPDGSAAPQNDRPALFKLSSQRPRKRHRSGSFLEQPWRPLIWVPVLLVW